MSVLDKYGKPKARTEKVSLSVKVPKELARTLEELARNTGYSKSEIVVDLVQDGLGRVVAMRERGAPNREA